MDRPVAITLSSPSQLHATPGPLRIQVRIADGHCHLLVEDSGPGVPEASATQIFEAFLRTMPDGNGSGLGLAEVQAIARAHGGGVTCGHSTLGGSIFDLDWPL